MIYHRYDDHYYYGRYKGSFSLWRILVWTIFHPGRLYNLFRFGQLFKLNSVRKKRLKGKLNVAPQSDNDQFFKNSKLIEKFDEFSENGAVILENFFNEKRIDKFLEKHKPTINDFLKTYKILLLEIQKLFIKNINKILNKTYITKKQKKKGTFHYKTDLPKLIKKSWKLNIKNTIKIYEKKYAI